jgi:hypothetical protein
MMCPTYAFGGDQRLVGHFDLENAAKARAA